MKQRKTSCPPVAAESAQSNPSAANGVTAPAAEPAWLRPLVEKIVGEVALKYGPAPLPPPFTDLRGLASHLPMYGERNLRDLIKRGIICSIRPPGSRKLGFHLPSVEAALLRYQKGGVE